MITYGRKETLRSWHSENEDRCNTHRILRPFLLRSAPPKKKMHWEGCKKSANTPDVLVWVKHLSHCLKAPSPYSLPPVPGQGMTSQGPNEFPTILH